MDVVGLAGVHVLVVDDAEDNLMLAERILLMAGANVSMARTANDGVATALTSKPDVVLLDLTLPDISGWEALAVLRRCGFTRPVVAFSAHAFHEQIAKARQHGFDEYITKPCPAKVLTGTLRRVVDHPQA